MEKPKTICAKCQNAVCASGAGQFIYAPWHQQLCRAFPAQEFISPVTGLVVGAENYGHRSGPYGFCRDHNHGDCPKFEERPESEE